jgi:hypothetical protein
MILGSIYESKKTMRRLHPYVGMLLVLNLTKIDKAEQKALDAKFWLGTMHGDGDRAHRVLISLRLI